MSKFCLCLSLLGVLLLQVCDTRSLLELKIECPHTVGLGQGLVIGTVDLNPVPVESVSTLKLESSCNFDVHTSSATQQAVTKWTWEKKADTAETAKAASTTFQSKSTELNLRGLCVIPTLVLETANKLRKTVTCYDLSCNQTACIPTVYLIAPIHTCVTTKSCLLGLGTQRIQVTYEKTYCVSGQLVEGTCFNPIHTMALSQPSHTYDIVTIPVRCFFIAKKTNDDTLKIEKQFETILEKSGCTAANIKGYYVCFLGATSEPIFVPTMDDFRASQILSDMAISPHGEDHDSALSSVSTFRIAGKLSGKAPSTESSDTVQGVAFSGHPLYTSLSVLASKEDPVYIWSPGIIPERNHTVCDKKTLPLTWTGYLPLPGGIEKTTQCTIFCTLAGPGADCEAYSDTGIFNISSPTCLINRVQRFRGAEQQIKFVCQRVDLDIVVYCNGMKKVILTKTLVIGQCIYTFTSVFSLMPGIAHSLAVELCVPGIHGWSTIALLATFCFGWLLIPIISLVSIKIMLLFAYMCSKYSNDSKFRLLIEKVKQEYQKTMGSMVCEVCQQECEMAKELESHKKSCPNGMCPYCMNPTESTESALQAHFKVCKLTTRFQENLRKSLNPYEPKRGCYRTLSVFRYRSRCFVGLVWCILLVLELVIWAASADTVEIKTGWTDTAHGAGVIPLKSDLELDFSLPSSATYIYRRDLQNPANEQERIPFHFQLQRQVIHAEIQNLGHWMDGTFNLKTSFHCYGACEKYAYPWQTAKCFLEKDYEFETGWGCNPGDCPGVGTGCTACGVYLDKLRSVGKVFKVISLKFTRRVCIQLGSEQSCKTIDSNDCLMTTSVKVCMIGTVSKFQPGDTLLFLGPLEEGGIIFKQWCTTTCHFGDPGDIMSTPQGMQCPEHTGAFRKKCAFATMPTCEYDGNTLSGYQRMLATRDSFQSFNITEPHITSNSLEWVDPDSSLKDHINLVVNRDVSFQDLSENPCQVGVAVSSIDGAWGSGVGFNLVCSVSLTECASFLTSIKACDAAMCYGATTANLVRGQNTVHILGKGGHSGSKFMCCHSTECSSTGLTAAAPHLDRVTGYNVIDNDKVFDDGSPECGVHCWFKKSGEWLMGILSGNWMVVAVLVVLLILSIFLFSLCCPRRVVHKKSS
ncbi:G1 and G2 proteins [Orthohantavirus prospectense]|uniref:Envelopment polyprotein n=3 Tax=Prospect Hill virus TaxID=3052492 RepID=GP_PHV|nr:G1 and G2 proteins [Orthohantavirus prospectense]P27315.1 RecName: Full=Envelopment polyprotein; AltName: Full=M polyprotein; Contains: RecName: Full=Glycoprotein N; Short=Gn; AltName: Full=Glycoprotein G1; Contains: RecName: Full=Glycoprotein C; Short=Gc; AltName: Full=Glycoprotein G2; Flags: Precursor [Orthohantavirus prospectense]CAA38922.1 G1 and G2 proteins [Orthohantavirus prospectense]